MPLAQKKNSSIPSLGVLLVNHNQWKLTETCIHSVLNSKDVEIVIGLVDNNSRESVPGWILENDSILFFRSESNSGFIAGNNTAYNLVVKRGVDYVILLNNDTEIESDTMSLLVSKLESNPSAGLVTPAIVYAGQREMIWHAGGKFIPWKMGMKPCYRTVSELPDEPVEIDLVSGCAMMMRVGLYEIIGKQNPDYFIYHEDTEQSIRTKKLGYKNFLVPRARVIHHVSVTTGGVMSPFAVYFTHRNRYLFAKRNLNWFEMALFTLYYFSTTLAKSIIYPLKNHSNLVYWMWLATFHGVSGKVGARPNALISKK